MVVMAAPFSSLAQPIEDSAPGATLLDAHFDSGSDGFRWPLKDQCSAIGRFPSDLEQGNATYSTDREVRREVEE
jgi:hypothetical protein